MPKTKLIVIALGAAFTFPAFAEDTPAALASPVAYDVGVVTDSVFRGVNQAVPAPSVQYAHASGLYVGTWASNVSWIKDVSPKTTGEPNVELDTYFGIKNALTSDYGYDVGYVRYNYMGAYSTVANFNNVDSSEVYGAASYKFVKLKYSYGLLDGVFTNPIAKGTNYIDLSANYPVDEAGVIIGAHVGKQTFVGSMADVYSFVGTNQTSTDYKLSASKDFSSYVVSFAYTKSNGTSFWAPNGDQLGKSATAVSVSHSF
jgi:uncharacterized protein (TIGR02001 family)